MKPILFRPFNFETAHGSKERVEWLRANHDKPVTEEEYIAALQSWKLPNMGRKHNKHYNSSAGKYQYKRLKRVYGFFGGIQ